MINYKFIDNFKNRLIFRRTQNQLLTLIYSNSAATLPTQSNCPCSSPTTLSKPSNNIAKTQLLSYFKVGVKTLKTRKRKHVICFNHVLHKCPTVPNNSMTFCEITCPHGPKTPQILSLAREMLRTSMIGDTVERHRTLSTCILCTQIQIKQTKTFLNRELFDILIFTSIFKRIRLASCVLCSQNAS